MKRSQEDNLLILGNLKRAFGWGVWSSVLTANVPPHSSTAVPGSNLGVCMGISVEQ